MVRANGTKSARVVSVIETKSIRGLGTEEDPSREVIQYWDFDGNFLAESDIGHCYSIIKHEYNAVKESVTSTP